MQCCKGDSLIKVANETGKFALSALLIISILLILVPAGGCTTAGSSINLTLIAPEYTITKDENGLDVIQMEDFPSNLSPGDPMLPHKVYNIAVPPDIIWSSLKLNIVSAETRVLEGTYDIKPSPPLAPQQEEGEGKDIVNGKNMKVYGTDANFPETYLTLLPYSQMRKWKFTKVDFTPFQYNPVSKKLTLIQSVNIDISYKQSSAELDKSLMKDTSMDNVAPEMFFNYGQAKSWYLK